MSSFNTLKERISSYEEAYDIKMPRRLPVIISLNGRSFRKATSTLAKPFSIQFMEAMCATMIKLASEIDGVSFIYSFNDEIVIILQNDQNFDTSPWYDNKIQKMSSAASSIATLEFNKQIMANDVDIIGDPVFIGNSFIVPSTTEAINLLISKQQQAFYLAVSFSSLYELLIRKKHNLDLVKGILLDKTLEEKINILSKECGINFHEYPTAFKRGFACYRVPKTFSTPNGNILKNKLIIDAEIPIFTKNYDFLNGILK